MTTSSPCLHTFTSVLAKKGSPELELEAGDEGEDAAGDEGLEGGDEGLDGGDEGVGSAGDEGVDSAGDEGDEGELEEEEEPEAEEEPDVALAGRAPPGEPTATCVPLLVFAMFMLAMEVS